MRGRMEKMRRVRLDRRTFFRMAATGAASLFPNASWAQRTSPAGSVEDVRGEAYAQTEAERRTLVIAAPLYINDLIGTGMDSRLSLHLGRDTTLRVGAHARVVIDRFLVNAGGEITLESGPILFERPSGSAPAPTQIRSPFALIAVRGTRFFAGPSAGVFGVFVERGSVTVSAAGKRVLLRAAQGTNINYPGAAPTPAAAWKPERIRAALDSVQ